jgi:hypothetical protein
MNLIDSVANDQIMTKVFTICSQKKIKRLRFACPKVLNSLVRPGGVLNLKFRPGV